MTRSSLKVLEAIMRLCDAGRPVTVRAIRDVMGWRSTGYAEMCLKELKVLGLITHEPTRHGTIRPRVRFIPEELL